MAEALAEVNEVAHAIAQSAVKMEDTASRLLKTAEELHKML